MFTQRTNLQYSSNALSSGSFVQYFSGACMFAYDNISSAIKSAV